MEDMIVDEVIRRKCIECSRVLNIKSFGKLGNRANDRRRKVCNRCHRAIIKAKNAKMDVKEFMSFSQGCCVFCGDFPTKPYYPNGSEVPFTRVCQKHLMVMHRLNEINEMLLIKGITNKFPFWLDFLKKYNLSLFKVDQPD